MLDKSFLLRNSQGAESFRSRLFAIRFPGTSSRPSIAFSGRSRVKPRHDTR